MHSVHDFLMQSFGAMIFCVALTLLVLQRNILNDDLLYFEDAYSGLINGSTADSGRVVAMQSPEYVRGSELIATVMGNLATDVVIDGVLFKKVQNEMRTVEEYGVMKDWYKKTNIFSTQGDVIRTIYEEVAYGGVS